MDEQFVLSVVVDKPCGRPCQVQACIAAAYTSNINSATDVPDVSLKVMSISSTKSPAAYELEEVKKVEGMRNFRSANLLLKVKGHWSIVHQLRVREIFKSENTRYGNPNTHDPSSSPAAKQDRCFS